MAHGHTYDHFAFPFTYDEQVGGYVVVEQDSDDEVLQNVEVLTQTPLGELIDVPEFGVPDPVFDTVIDTQGVERAIDRWEPRALALVADSIDPLDELRRLLEIRVRSRMGAVR